MDIPFFDAQRGIITTPIISAALTEMVQYATNLLAPKLCIDVQESDIPRTFLGNGPWYNAGLNILTLRPNNILQERDETLGHEVIHFLHSRKNPYAFEKLQHDNESANLAELVAEYGSLVFSASEHPEISGAKQTIIEEVDKLEERLKSMLRFRTQIDRIFTYETHEGGERAARFLFEFFGDRYLNEMADVDTNAAKKLLRHLGYLEDLFVPYQQYYTGVSLMEGEEVGTVKLIIKTLSPT